MPEPNRLLPLYYIITYICIGVRTWEVGDIVKLAIFERNRITWDMTFTIGFGLARTPLALLRKESFSQQRWHSLATAASCLRKQTVPGASSGLVQPAPDAACRTDLLDYLDLFL